MIYGFFRELATAERYNRYRNKVFCSHERRYQKASRLLQDCKMTIIGQYGIRERNY
jgi:hypothetical protein